MRKVVDSNQLQSPAFRAWLSKSTMNFAVLTDYASMEAYKGDTLKSIFRSMEIVSDFPDQILVLKSTNVVCGLTGRSAGLQKRLIDENQSREFGIYARRLAAAKNGNLNFQQQLLERGQAAKNHLDRMLEDAKTITSDIKDVAKLYTKDERHIIRLHEPYPSALMDKMGRDVLELAGILFSNHPSVRTLPKFDELLNTYIFRISLCMYLLALDWAALGGVDDVSPARLRNDMVDMSFAAYGTFFDGVLSADAKVLRIHKEARIILDEQIMGSHLIDI